MSERPIRRILIVKLWALGDIVMTLPLADALKRLIPDCHISWLVEAGHAAILEGHPAVDEVIPFDSGAWRRDLKKGRLGAYLRTALGLRRRMTRERFDAAVNLTPEKSWTRFFSIARKTVALYPHPASGFIARTYTTTIARPRADETHNSDFALLALIALNLPHLVGAMMLPVADERDAAVRRRLADVNVRNKPVVVVHPGTSQETKCWPAEQFSLLIDALTPDAQVVITGSPSEAGLGKNIVDGLRAPTDAPINAIGSANILDTVAWINNAAVVVTGDTVALHIASALSRPIVAIYGGTRPGRNAARSVPAIAVFNDAVLCAPCYAATCRLPEPERLKCLTSINVERVLGSVRALLTSGEPRTC